MPLIFVMMRKEFETLSGICVSNIAYKFIEEEYYKTDLPKNEFAKLYAGDKDLQARVMEKTDKAVTDDLAQARKPYADKILELEARVRELERENKFLNEELEILDPYGPYEWSHMTDAEYERLAKSCERFAEPDSGDAVMSDENAAQWIYEEWGFEKHLIEIIHSATVYEISKRGKLRKTGERERLPRYDATDWNYILFECRGLRYECVNDSLYMV